jgi:hypothetical protein
MIEVAAALSLDKFKCATIGICLVHRVDKSSGVALSGEMAGRQQSNYRRGVRAAPWRAPRDNSAQQGSLRVREPQTIARAAV